MTIDRVLKTMLFLALLPAAVAPLGLPAQAQQAGPTVSDLRSSNQAAWPFAAAPLSSLRSSPKKVFAHYLPAFPISIDNRLPDRDYYQTQYLAPGGEAGKHLAYGGFLRDRPLPRAQRPEKDWAHLDMQDEVRRASALGLDGFSVDVLAASGPLYDRAVDLMTAAHEVDPSFKVMLMPDMDALKQHPELVVGLIERLAQSPSAYRAGDGRLVLCPYDAQAQSVAWWKQTLATLRGDGVNVEFLPLFQNWYKYAKDFAPISAGFSDWGGTRDALDEAASGDATAAVHQFVPLWMAPVSPQDMRPKVFSYAEAGGSGNYRQMWENAITSEADMVQIATWNDYSESSHVAPSAGIGYSFYDLTGYYVQWFKTGAPPPVTRDVVYYFHRSQFTSAAPDLTKQAKAFQVRGSMRSQDGIEALTFLTAPAVLGIKVGPYAYYKTVPAGVTATTVPLSVGRPEILLQRGGKTVQDVSSATVVAGTIQYQDLLYRGGSSAR